MLRRPWSGCRWIQQAIGAPADVALTTATTFRLVTFYLPPIYGFFGIRFLRKHEYV